MNVVRRHTATKDHRIHAIIIDIDASSTFAVSLFDDVACTVASAFVVDGRGARAESTQDGARARASRVALRRFRPR